MPIYEYHCDDCGSSFETLVQPGHYRQAECPSCSGANISREMSVFSSRALNSRAETNSPAAARGGGCCGGSCGCH
ncbi:MAG: zinc ribbon domain-containing protein [Deltaproteobacteria bacterium]|nr:zinc ribbon domain-containing protein [Deltaproteobacteria bacterium]